MFALIPHPAGDPCFFDDSVPAVMDRIAGYGTLGFNKPGQHACPGDVDGACCFRDGTCLILSTLDCGARGGTFLGGSCHPDPCPNASSVPERQAQFRTWGRIKNSYR